MSDEITRHDARALMLIDYALHHGFTPGLVEQITEALDTAHHTETVQSRLQARP